MQKVNTPHLGADRDEIAEIVFLFGDPVRTKRASNKFLENPKEVSAIRAAGYYTGEYKGRKITFGTSGMGFGSMGIYSYELFHFYDVKKIIRIGTSGAYSKILKVKDIVLVEESKADHTFFAEANLGEKIDSLKADPELIKALEESANSLGIAINKGKAHSTDIFYSKESIEELIDRTQAICVEMESFSLLVNAKRNNKQAACLLMITDHLVTHEHMSAEDREIECDTMIQLALNIVL